MDQFRQVGEAIGSIRALMVFRSEIRINQRQCDLLVDAYNLAFEGIADEIRQHLRFEDRATKWKPLEHPLRELYRVLREGEQFIRQCLDARDWWAKAVALGQSTDAVDLHLHNLLWCVPVVLEAIECVAEISGTYHDDVMKRRLVFSKKYEREWMEPKLFQHKFGRLYLVSHDMCTRLDTVYKEDRWILSESISEKRTAGLKPLTKQESRLAELLTSPKGKLFPCSVLTGSSDYQVRRRLGSGNNYKEIQWKGESFAAKHVIGDIDPVKQEISVLSTLSHPNLMNCLYAFCDEEKKECLLLMELMNKDLSSYIKENSSAKKRVPFSLPVAVDIMLQTARAMQYLHSQKVYHGDLNPSNILVKSRSSSPDGYLHVKIAGFGLPPKKNSKSPANQTSNGNGKASYNQLANGNAKVLPNQVANGNGKASANQIDALNQYIWYAPEVLSEQEPAMENSSSRHTEKADVYSFGMICFELLTGKIPFEDAHLQGDKISRNIRAGERPLFPFPLPRYLSNLTKRCWQSDPSQRPSFSSISRVLRYTKRFLIMNPDQSQPDSPVPQIDYFDLDVWLSKKFINWTRNESMQVSDIPFQMYAYRVIERERNSVNMKEKSSESGSEGTSLCGDDTPFNTLISEECLSVSSGRSSSQASSEGSKRGSAKKVNGTPNKQTGNNQKVTPVKPPKLRITRVGSANQLQQIASTPGRPSPSGPSSDSEIA